MAICFIIDLETMCIHYAYSLTIMGYFIIKTVKDSDIKIITQKIIFLIGLFVQGSRE